MGGDEAGSPRRFFGDSTGNAVARISTGDPIKSTTSTPAHQCNRPAGTETAALPPWWISWIRRSSLELTAEEAIEHFRQHLSYLAILGDHPLRSEGSGDSGAILIDTTGALPSPATPEARDSSWPHIKSCRLHALADQVLDPQARQANGTYKHQLRRNYGGSTLHLARNSSTADYARRSHQADPFQRRIALITHLLARGESRYRRRNISKFAIREARHGQPASISVMAQRAPTRVSRPSSSSPVLS